MGRKPDLLAEKEGEPGGRKIDGRRELVEAEVAMVIATHGLEGLCDSPIHPAHPSVKDDTKRVPTCLTDQADRRRAGERLDTGRAGRRARSKAPSK
jgi:hypothetical protein